MKFTDKAIQALKYTLSQKVSTGKRSKEGVSGKPFYPLQFVWDETFSGFGVRIFPPDKDGVSQKRYVYKYRINRKQHINTIGSVEKMSLKDAKLQARKDAVKIAEGVDPIQEKQRESNGELMSALCDKYINEHAKPKKKSWKIDLGRNQLYIIPALGSMKVKQIEQSDIAKLHHEIGEVQKKPYVANRVREQLGKMFELAKTWKYVDKTFVNPARGIVDFKESERDDYIQPDDMPILAAAIEREPNIVARCLVWLYLLTGKRKNELLQAKWSDVDEAHKTLKLSDTKNNEVEYLTLSGSAWKILEQAKTFRAEGSPYIFPGPGAHGHFVNIRKPWERIKADAVKNGALSVKDVPIHGLRHTFAVWMVSMGGADLGMIRRLLNQKSLLATKVYAKHLQTEVRKASERQGDLVELFSKPRVEAAPTTVEPIKTVSARRAKKGFVFRRKRTKA